tara:strand:+ start:73352 stop:73807 length:456 start_codon:yes stop_codon:yes gene_type:complete
MTELTLDDLRARTGQELGTSDWVTIDQAAIDQFAACTGDAQFIHTDPDRARQSRFGGTIAHGLLTLSILAPLQQPFTRVKGTAMTVNCGFNRVRFLTPVPVGSRIRGRFILKAVEETGEKQIQIILESIAELEGAERPAAIADLVLRKYLS